MDSENSDNNNVNNAVNNSSRNNYAPVEPETSGIGLPYAPENFPNPGDIWRWRSGKRISSNGNYRDRYLYLPSHLSEPVNRTSYRGGFASKLAVQRYVTENFPNVNIRDFFASFSWKIPSGLSGNMNPKADDDVLGKEFELEKESESDNDADRCKAGNQKCSSLISEEEKEHSQVMPCDICCAEPEFCRECCCILCYKTVDPAYGGYSYIMCKVNVGDYICGHICHLECALRAYTAGTLGGTFGMDAEYFCRRCDGRTELISHVDKLMQTCQAIDTENDIKEKMLNLGICLLRGSQKAAAKELMSHMVLAMSKLKRGTNTEDTLNVDDNLTSHSAGFSNNDNAAMDTTDDEGPSSQHVTRGTKPTGYHQSESLMLEAEVDQALEALRKSQNREYNLAKESLNAQKTYLHNLREQFEMEKFEVGNAPDASRLAVLLETVFNRNEQLKREVLKFEDMKKVANGFGSTSKDILEKRFGL